MSDELRYGVLVAIVTVGDLSLFAVGYLLARYAFHVDHTIAAGAAVVFALSRPRSSR